VSSTRVAQISQATRCVTALWVLVALGMVFLLRAARPFLIPIAVAILISYALEPIVAWLERHRVPRLAGSALVLLLILGAAAGGAYAGRDDAAWLVETLPDTVQRAREKLVSQLGVPAEVVEEAVKDPELPVEQIPVPPPATPRNDPRGWEGR
jgi:predicted PurR-regulated permease PerM